MDFAEITLQALALSHFGDATVGGVSPEKSSCVECGFHIEGSGRIPLPCPLPQYAIVCKKSTLETSDSARCPALALSHFGDATVGGAKPQELHRVMSAVFSRLGNASKTQ